MPEPGRVCDGENCKELAVVHVKQIVGGEESDHHYCRACAQRKGISPKPGGDIAALLAQLGEAAAPPDPCSFCGLTWSEFRRRGRLGCPECYAAFEPNLRRVLHRVHGAAQHAGKVYLPPDPAGADVDRRIGSLRRRLQRAVEAEDFEMAAQLRDRILEMEPAE